MNFFLQNRFISTSKNGLSNSVNTPKSDINLHTGLVLPSPLLIPVEAAKVLVMLLLLLPTTAAEQWLVQFRI
jgi:hypothetical protein